MFYVTNAAYRHLMRSTGHTGTIHGDPFALAFNAARLITQHVDFFTRILCLLLYGYRQRLRI
jgi:hypothetical protein